MNAVTVGRLELSGHVLRGSDGQGAIADTPEHARRLAACWNACEGLTTEQLEKFPGWAEVGMRPLDSMVQMTGELAQARIDRQRVEDNYDAVCIELAAARPAIDACAGVPSFLLLPGSVRRQIDELAAAYALLAEVLAVDDKLQDELLALRGVVRTPNTTLRPLTERIRTLLDGTRQLTTPDAAVRDAAWKATRLAADLGQVLTISQIPRLPLAMGNYDTVVTVRPARVMAEKGGAA